MWMFGCLVDLFPIHEFLLVLLLLDCCLALPISALFVRVVLMFAGLWFWHVFVINLRIWCLCGLLLLWSYYLLGEFGLLAWFVFTCGVYFLTLI